MAKDGKTAKPKRPQWADRLEAARTIRFESQADFARHLGMSPSRYGNYEQGTREPDYLTLVRICETLDISADWLLTGKSRPNIRVAENAA